MTEEGIVRSPIRPGPDPLIGRDLLHYKVLEVIGQGGMSVVYHGRDEHLHRDVAIKVLHPFLAEKPDARARLAREARAVARLEHPHILKVYDYSGDATTLDERPGEQRDDDDGGLGFIVTELVRGTTLKRFAERNLLWRVPEVGALLTWQLARAVAHAHAQGVVHRDIKPENVMVRDDGVLKLMDFGIAQLVDQAGLTVTGTLLGSPAHMAPECIDGFPADERSDIFSLGTVLYWLTTGALPFEAPTPHALLKAIVDGNCMPAQQRSPRISDHLGRVITSALATKPAERTPSAAALAAALEGVLSLSGLTADSNALSTILGDPPKEMPRVASLVREAFLERAQRLLEEGAPTRALAALARVLAESPDDPEAKALLERVQDGQSETLVTAASTTMEPVPPPQRESASVWLKRALVAGAAVGLIGAAVTVAVFVDDKDAERPKPDEQPRTEPVATLPVAVDVGRPIATEPLPEPPKRKPTRPTTTTTPAGPTLAAKPPVVEPAVTVGAARKTTLRAWPWADIYVDGTRIATAQSMPVSIDLPPGSHVAVFKNPSAKDVEERFLVPPDGSVPEVKVRLEPRPALLTVKSNVDAIVTVDGKVRGNASASASHPLVVPLDFAKSAELEVVVYAKGYRPRVLKHRFRPGASEVLEAMLETEAP
jgi:serine/threonine-protein kinase